MNRQPYDPALECEYCVQRLSENKHKVNAHTHRRGICQFSYNVRTNFAKPLRSSIGLVLSTIQGIGVSEQTLSGRIRIRNFAIIHKRDRCHSPALNQILLFNGISLLQHCISNCTSKFLATLHPNVPAPNSKHFADDIHARSSSGISLHFMSFKFKFTEFLANRSGSIDAAIAAIFGNNFP